MDLKPLFDGKTFLERRKCLPRRSGVYLVYSGIHTLYVGQSADLRGRWGGHHKTPYLRAMPSPRIAWRLVPEDSLLAEEQGWLTVLGPYLQGRLRFRPADTSRVVASRAAHRYGQLSEKDFRKSPFAALAWPDFVVLARAHLAGVVSRWARNS